MKNVGFQLVHLDMEYQSLRNFEEIHINISEFYTRKLVHELCFENVQVYLTAFKPALATASIKQ